MSSTLSDLILSYIESEAEDVYTALPATITSVKNLTSENRISVQPAIDIVDDDGESYQFPVLDGIPVKWPGGGGGVITFPLKVGDDVMVIFSMKSIAEFQASTTGTVQPYDNRLHNLSDAYADPSIYRDADNPEPSADNTEIKFNGGSIEITPDGNIQIVTTSSFSVTNPTTELIQKLNDTLTKIANTTVNTYYGPVPLNDQSAILTLIDDLRTFEG